MVRTVTATRYVTPLREGGSLPAVVEADDDGMYVVKFRGAGQGPKALIAELVVGETARALGLPMPELVLIDLDPALAAAEPDEEIQDLLERSAGLNLGMDFLPGALPIGAPGLAGIEPALAADVVWFDAFTSDVDRTPRNPNLLLWHRKLWLIDHGASLYTHHGWQGKPGEQAAGAVSRFPAIRDHVLLPIAGSILDADARLAGRLDVDDVRRIAEMLPDAWLIGASPWPDDPDAHRAAYAEYLWTRLQAPRGWVEEAEQARQGAHRD
ncbi:MAG: HipA family kinase [Thermomicrobiales bacterium]